MRQTFIIAIVMVVALQGAHAALLTGGGSSFEASLLYYQPVPAQAGDVLDVYITVENDGSAAARNVRLEVIESYPFSTDSQSERVKFAGTIPAQESFLFKTKVRVDKDANAGTNYLPIRVGEEGKAMQETDLAIDIIGQKSALTISDANVVPERLTPGARGEIALEITNIGNTIVRNIDVSLDLSDVSLIPYSDSSSEAIAELSGGQSHTFRFDVLAAPEATPGAYRVPLSIDYLDEEGDELEQAKSIGVVVGSEPELLVYFDTVDLTYEMLSGEVVMRIVNKGLDEVKLVQLQVNEEQGVEVTSESATIYVGNIDEDDYETATLNIKVANGTEYVPITLTYKDSLNQPYTQAFQLPLRLHHRQNGGGMNWPIIILVILVIGGAAIWYLRRKRKR